MRLKGYLLPLAQELEHVPRQFELQLSAQCLLQLPWQVLKQEFMQRLLQPEQDVDDASEALARIGIFANAIAPKIGRAPLAALLKNSRRDWSSSFLFFSIFMKMLVNTMAFAVNFE